MLQRLTLPNSLTVIYCFGTALLHFEVEILLRVRLLDQCEMPPFLGVRLEALLHHRILQQLPVRMLGAADEIRIIVRDFAEKS